MDNMTVPYSAEAEASVLGSVIFNPRKICRAPTLSILKRTERFILPC